jgi:undecaprenyl-diphosphatase
MEVIKSIILGIIQGLTEFIPVSSSGHLTILKHFFHIDDLNTSFDILLHLGTVISVIYFFRKKIFELIKSLIKYNDDKLKSERQYFLHLVIVSLITGSLGFLMQKKIETIFSNVILVAIMFTITGIVVIFSDKIKHKETNTNMLDIKKTIFIGLGQTISIIPGLSRSGFTIFSSLIVGLEREKAATFSFLVSIPVILGANILKINELLKLSLNDWLIYSVGFIFSLLTGYLVIRYLMNLIIKAKLFIFGIYCIILSFVSFSLIILGY